MTKDNVCMETKEIRRLRLKEWFKDRTLPPKEKSYLSQLMSGKATFGEKAARRIEQTYGMPGGYLDIEPEDIAESPSSRSIALTPNQLELLQIFSAFPDNEQQEIIKELKNKKEAMEDLVARWLARQGRRA
ncbi:hypothetical protein BTQ04_18930 [Escherichia coli]|nr:hypothetical protein BTQ04_18930 [Escherichia coli]